MSKENRKLDAGSRMHVLDWLESPNFLLSLQALVAPTRFKISDSAVRQPKGRNDPKESKLIGKTGAQFLTDEDDKRDLCKWWVRHGSSLPSWDLVVEAQDALDRPALILVEAKAHMSELGSDGKKLKRSSSANSKENHEHIDNAIKQAVKALRRQDPQISLNIAESYQFANRIAFPWKLATFGIPVAMIYLGFLGDNAIAENADDRINSPTDWKAAFRNYAGNFFPEVMWEREIKCDLDTSRKNAASRKPASFWLLVREKSVINQSPPKEQRKNLKNT